MTTPHRGLPPPSSILAESNRLGSSSSAQPGHMPAPPMQWQGQEDSMRNWLAAKAEEDKRKQEEERTRQETLKLEQRRIEQSMLRESLSGGVPPHMIPLIYAGIGGGFTQLSMDWLHQYAGQLQSQQQQLPSSSPELRSQRMLGQAAYQGPAAGQHGPVQYAVETVPQQAPPAQQTYATYAAPSRTAPTSAPRSIAQAQLPRLTTNDAFVQQTTTSNNPGSAHPLQQSQTLAHDGPASSPNIYFHHWVPPADSKNPQTPATKTRREDEPMSALPHLSDGESKDSPRKRKAQGGHQANAPPATTAAQYGSPSFSTTSSVSSKRVGHQRNRSTASFKEDSRPDSRKEELHRMSFQQAVQMREDEEPVERSSASRGEAAAGAERQRPRSRESVARIPEERPIQTERPPS